MSGGARPGKAGHSPVRVPRRARHCPFPRRLLLRHKLPTHRESWPGEAGCPAQSAGRLRGRRLVAGSANRRHGRRLRGVEPGCQGGARESGPEAGQRGLCKLSDEREAGAATPRHGQPVRWRRCAGTVSAFWKKPAVGSLVCNGDVRGAAPALPQRFLLVCGAWAWAWASGCRERCCLHVSSGFEDSRTACAPARYLRRIALTRARIALTLARALTGAAGLAARTGAAG